MRPDTPRTAGSVFLGAGSVLVAVLALTGLSAAFQDAPDMVHMSHIAGTCLGGPTAVGLVTLGFVLRRGHTQR